MVSVCLVAAREARKLQRFSGYCWYSGGSIAGLRHTILVWKQLANKRTYKGPNRQNSTNFVDGEKGQPALTDRMMSDKIGMR